MPRASTWRPRPATRETTNSRRYCNQREIGTRQVTQDAPVREETGASEEKRPSFFSRLSGTFLRRREVGIFAVAVALLIYFQSVNSAFLSQGNIRTLAQFVAATAIVAFGLVMVMILGEIDLSVGQAFAFAPIVMYLAYESLFLTLPLAIVVGLLATAGVGFINGAIRVYFGVPSFVTTLGMFFLLAGTNVILTGGFPKIPPEAGWINQVFGAHPLSGIVWCAVILVGMHLLLNYTRWGIYTFADRKSTRLNSSHANISYAVFCLKKKKHPT